MLLGDLSLILLSQILHLLPKPYHPKLLASTAAVAVQVANQRCVLWSTLGRWFLLCSASWESTELNVRTTVSSKIW